MRHRTSSRLRRALWASALLAGATGALGCEDPGATVTMTDTRVSRDPERNVLVDIDLLAHEGLGRNVGYYCVRVTFMDDKFIQEECHADLEDGDTKTMRVVGPNLNPGALIKLRLRLSAADQRIDVFAPQ